VLIAEYEKKLKSAGVNCELHLVKGALHGFISRAGLQNKISSKNRK